MKNKCKNKLKNGEIVIGTFLTLNSLELAQLFSNNDYDFLMIDSEHGALNIETIGQQISLIKNKTTPLLRIPYLDIVNTKKGLDSGAFGIMVPMINTKNDIENFIKMTTFPPTGIRGCGATRANMFYTEANEYFKFADTEILRIIQIETKEALDNLDEILSIKGIDVAFLGPYDMSFSLGIPGDISNPLMEKVSNKIIQTCNKYGVYPGIMSNPNDFKKHINMGFKFIIEGLDSLLIDGAIKNSIEYMRNSLDN